jgi:hypothetical protein
MNDKGSHLVELPRGTWGEYWALFPMGIIFFVVSFNIDVVSWYLRIMGAIICLPGLCMFILPSTILDLESRRVDRKFRLFGRYTLRNRTFSFSEFDAVLIRRVRKSYYAGGILDDVIVSLKFRRGRQLRIAYFAANPVNYCRSAEELAARLSADLNIEIEERHSKRYI